jgi:hypothetical protein
MAKRAAGPTSSATVSRAAFEALARTVDKQGRDLDLQFQRIAQIQAELDHIRIAWSKGAIGQRKKLEK